MEIKDNRNNVIKNSLSGSNLIALEITGPKENQSSHTNGTYKVFDAEPTSF